MKKCLFEACEYNVFSHNYCQKHQYARKDEKWLLSLEKKKGKQKLTTGEGDIFEKLFDERENISFISGVKIDNISHMNCAHILSKAQNKYPKFKLNPDNIVFLTTYEHFLFDHGNASLREQYRVKMKAYGVIVDWGKLFSKAEELKKKYIKKLETDIHLRQLQ